MKQTKPCPECKKKHGWWEARRQFYDQYFLASGEPSHATDGTFQHGKVRRCYNCNTVLSSNYFSPR